MMCFRFQNADMLEWLKSQVRVLEAWREDIASRPDIDLEMVTRLEHHYQWLTSEVMTLEKLTTPAPTAPHFEVLRSAY